MIEKKMRGMGITKKRRHFIHFHIVENILNLQKKSFHRILIAASSYLIQQSAFLPPFP